MQTEYEGVEKNGKLSLLSLDDSLATKGVDDVKSTNKPRDQFGASEVMDSYLVRNFLVICTIIVANTDGLLDH